MSDIEKRRAIKAAMSSPENLRSGEFFARVFLLNNVDLDGEVILDIASNDGQQLESVSVRDHDSMPPPFGKGLDSAGEGRLVRLGSAVYCAGRVLNTPRGRELRDGLQAGGPYQQWSVGIEYKTVRKPSAQDRAIWPDALRIIEDWDVFEASPVRQGSCGGTCRTLASKCAGGSCGCGKVALPPQRPTDIKEWIPTYESEKAALAVFREAVKRWGIRTPPAVKWFKGPIPRCVGQYLAEQNPPEVWVATGLSPYDSAETLLHELRHHLQSERGEPSYEPEAEGYSRVLARRLRDEGILE